MRWCRLEAVARPQILGHLLMAIVVGVTAQLLTRADASAQRLYQSRKLVADVDQWLVERDIQPPRLREEIQARHSHPSCLSIGRHASNLLTALQSYFLLYHEAKSEANRDVRVLRELPVRASCCALSQASRLHTLSQSSHPVLT